MEEELSVSDFRLLYHIESQGGFYRGSIRKLAGEVKSGNRTYERIAKLKREGYLEDRRPKGLKLTEKAEEVLGHFRLARMIIKRYLPVLGSLLILLGWFWTLLPSAYTPLSLIFGGLAVIAAVVVFCWTERKAGRRLIDSLRRA